MLSGHRRGSANCATVTPLVDAPMQPSGTALTNSSQRWLPPSSTVDCKLRAFRSSSDGIRLVNESIAVKSKLGAEWRRYTVHFMRDPLSAGPANISFDVLRTAVLRAHGLSSNGELTHKLLYESADGCCLPICNDETLQKALFDRGYRQAGRRAPSTVLLRLLVEPCDSERAKEAEQFGYGLSPAVLRSKRLRPSISQPRDFRRVSSILDADLLPCHLRRVRLCKHDTTRPLGFYIRDGFIAPDIAQPWPLRDEEQRGVFISRLVPNGLAASTNLLAVGDQVVEVNGIQVNDKTLDQVTDMMVANSDNLVLTVRPVHPFPSVWAEHRRSYGTGLRSTGSMLTENVLSPKSNHFASISSKTSSSGKSGGWSSGGRDSLSGRAEMENAGMLHSRRSGDFLPSVLSRLSTWRLSDKLNRSKRSPPSTDAQREEGREGASRPMTLYEKKGTRASPLSPAEQRRRRRPFSMIDEVAQNDALSSHHHHHHAFCHQFSSHQ